ncbi:HAD family hydrolase [Nocardioides sp. R1-1]|uniref:HAD family hydrolase n=1 Tax=Nocardioides sp. R1-1 TaxID=3383502 RepID=UPI0038CF3A97
MRLPVGPDTQLVLDLDDTLYPEIDFVASGFRAVARALGERAPSVGPGLLPAMWERYQAGQNAFAWAAEHLAAHGVHVSVAAMLRCYRTHDPDIAPGPGVRRFLDDVVALGAGVSLLTDGRSITQRNKVRALGLTRYLTDLVISEEVGVGKPDARSYRLLEERHPGKRFVCIADNTAKDFVVPARLGWRSVCLRDTGRHIHPQHPHPDPRPDHVVDSFEEIVVVAAGPTAAAAEAPRHR